MEDLAAARERGAWVYRPGLPSHQQIVQPLLQRTGFVEIMYQILKQIAKTGIVTEHSPAPDEALRASAQRLGEVILKHFGRALAIRHVDAGSCNGCELEIHAMNSPFYNPERPRNKFRARPPPAHPRSGAGPGCPH